MLRRVLLTLLAVVSALGLAVAGRIAWVGLAWARTRPAAEPLPGDRDAEPGRPWWPVFGLPFLLPLMVLVALGRRGPRR